MSALLDLRSPEQRACDRLLLLWLIGKSSRLDLFKLQKLPFRVDIELNAEGKRGFNYEFFQYDQGPLSKNVYDDRDDLKALSLIVQNGVMIQVTSKGKKLLSEFDHVLSKNPAIAQKMMEVLERFSRMTGFELVKDTHQISIEWHGKRIKLGEIPKHSTILPCPEKASLEIDGPTLETLVILTEPELINAIRMVRREGSTSSLYSPLTT